MEENKENKNEYKRPDYMRIDPQQPDQLHVNHRELEAVLQITRPTLRRNMELERIKGMQMGAFPTPDGEALAEHYATISVGFDKLPERFDLGDVVDEELLHALYKEVLARWATFRSSQD